MKLDRNINNDGAGKYALLKLRVYRDLADDARKRAADAMALLEGYGILDWGIPESESEFFLIRLKDKYAGDAIRAYADAVQKDAQQERNEVASRDKYQWAVEVLKLCERAGDLSPFCKQPD